MNAANPVGRQNLGGVFGGGEDRTSGLGGLPARRARMVDPIDEVPQAQPDPEPEVPAAPVTPTPSKPAKPAKTKDTSAAPAADEEHDGAETAGREPFQVYMPSDVIERFRERRKAEGTTSGLLFLEAIDYAVDLDSDTPYKLLSDLVGQTLVGLKSKKSLFDREPTRIKTADLGPRSQLLMQLSPQEKQVINMLIKETKAVDRGHLAEVAITYYLDNTTPQGD